MHNMFSWNELKHPIIALSPMADMSDMPFCLIAKELGAEIMFREMISSEALVRGSVKTLKMAEFDQRERPIIQQIFGGDPKTMGTAAEIIEHAYHPDGIDINMGCPVYKIVSNFNGASLMRDKETACAIVREMKKKISVPLSVKIRLGWSEKTEALEFARYLEEAGADLITIHGRTKTQGYSGVSDLEMIARVKERVSIPVLANGDIHTPEQVKGALEISGCDGVLIARGCLGNPWFFREARYALSGKLISEITNEEKFRVCLKHARYHVAHYGERGITTFRKHLSWYLKGIPGIKEMRTKIMEVTTISELEFFLISYLENTASL